MNCTRLKWAGCMLVLALLVHAPRPVGAVGMNLSWNDCPAGPTAAWNKTFACNTNAGSEVLVISFVPPDGLATIVGLNAIVDLYSETCPMTNWWQFKNAGSCRLTALSLGTLPLAGQTGCADAWQGTATGGIAAYYTTAVLPSLAPNRTRILGVVGVPDPAGVPVSPNTEYYGCNIVISNAKTVGSGACGGCTDHVCMIVPELDLVGPDNGDWRITNPLDTQIADWQSGQFYCFGSDGGGPPSCNTPALNRTWGQIKTIYR